MPTPEEAVTAATETYLKVSAQDDETYKAAGENLAKELDKDKTIEMWNSFADEEDAKFEEVAAAAADALKTES